MMLEEYLESLADMVRLWNPEPAAFYIGKLITAILASLFSLSHPTWYPQPANVCSSYDFVIVGGGLAGSALAYRLSENHNYNVLLVEAGPLPPYSADVPYLSTSLQRTHFDWRYQTVPQTFACRGYNDGVCYLPRGRMLGGSSLLTNTIYITGTKKDYNRWMNMDSPGWGWDDVEPYFDRFVNDFGVNHYESKIGSCYDITDCIKHAIIYAARELGFIETKHPRDIIAGKIGYFRARGLLEDGLTNHAGKLFISTMAQRQNVDIVTSGFVTRLKINPDSREIEGVNVRIDPLGFVRYVRVTKEVILCAGAINNPKILMLSGVGPKEHLEDNEIRVIHDLPGVGKNFHDHVSLPVIAHKVHDKKCLDFDDTLAAHTFLIQREGPLTSIGVSNILGYIYARAGERSDFPNIEMRHQYLHRNYVLSFLTKYAFLPELGRLYNATNSESAILIQIPTLLKPRSRGVVRLHSDDPADAPLIDPQYLTHPEDVSSLIRGARHALEMGKTKAMKKMHAEFISPPLVDCDAMIGACSNDGLQCCEFDSECYWRCLMRAFGTTGHAPGGTMKMGKCGECSEAVVDSNLKVHGIKGVRVADASILPESISGSWNAVAIMIGERASDIIRKDYEKIPPIPPKIAQNIDMHCRNDLQQCTHFNNATLIYV